MDRGKLTEIYTIPGIAALLIELDVCAQAAQLLPNSVAP